MTPEQQIRALELLLDASFMLADIKKARELPAYGQVWKQYVALGRDISKFLQEVKVMSESNT